jgi:Flp pilus assembly protein TadD
MTDLAELPDRECLAELLLRWEELFEKGQDTPASQLAKDRPDLIPELARQIHALKTVSWIMKPLVDQPMGQSSPQPLRAEGERLAGRYRLETLVAEGGFAEVYRAFDEELQRTVAIKMPKPGRLGSGDAFLAEARRVARLRHEGIVPVYDVGMEGDTCFIVSEFLEGGSLADRLVKGKPSRDEAIRWICEIADALEHAHLHGVVHRDIKPGNILVDHRGRAKLADFGIAQSAAKAGDSGPSLGTLSYMSAEQLQGNPTDHRTDIYSLGIVLHELLTGEVPYASLEPPLLRRDIVGGKPNLSDQLPPPLRDICRKALSVDPQARQTSATQFAAEVRRVAGLKRGQLVWPWLLTGVAAIALVAGRFLSFTDKDQPPRISPAEAMATATTDLLAKRYAEAEDGFTRILLADPGNAEALKGRGNCRLQLKMLNEAVTDLTAALEVNPDDPIALKYRGLAYAELRNFPKAIDDFSAVTQLIPESREIKEQLATVYAIRSHERFENGQFALAADDMTEAIGLAPDSPINYHRRGACWFHMGEYQRAYDDLTVAIGKEPGKADHYDNRAQTLQRMGRNDEAEADFKKARGLRGQ